MDVYGPPLPPGFKVSTDDDSDDESNEPPNKITKFIGPKFPSFLAQNELDEDSNSSDDSNKRKVIGPSLPKSYKETGPETIGPSEGNEDTNDNNEVYGPMPPVTQDSYDVISTIEKRAAKMKDKLDMKDTPVVKSVEREEWMVVPDTSRRNQLGAISRCLAPGSKVSKKKSDSHRNYEEDKKTTEKLKKYNEKKRNESLLDIHRKKKKDKEREKEKVKERKAFDRDDMGIRYFTKRQVDSVIDKAKYLNSRFAPGRSQQYL